MQNPSFIRDGDYRFHWFAGGGVYDSFPSGHMTATCAFLSVILRCRRRGRRQYPCGHQLPFSWGRDFGCLSRDDNRVAFVCSLASGSSRRLSRMLKSRRGFIVRTRLATAPAKCSSAVPRPNASSKPNSSVRQVASAGRSGQDFGAIFSVLRTVRQGAGGVRRFPPGTTAGCDASRLAAPLCLRPGRNHRVSNSAIDVLCAGVRAVVARCAVAKEQ
jgi:hypothetical protein